MGALEQLKLLLQNAIRLWCAVMVQPVPLPRFTVELDARLKRFERDFTRVLKKSRSAVVSDMVDEKEIDSDSSGQFSGGVFSAGSAPPVMVSVAELEDASKPAKFSRLLQATAEVVDPECRVLPSPAH